jgi:hypothetical protein
MASLPTLSEGIALTHFIGAEDVERAGRFYSDFDRGYVGVDDEIAREVAIDECSERRSWRSGSGQRESRSLPSATLSGPGEKNGEVSCLVDPPALHGEAGGLELVG